MTTLPNGRYCAYLCARAEMAGSDINALREFLELAQSAANLLQPSPPCERCVKRITELIAEAGAQA